jgi:hypothetical protein
VNGRNSSERYIQSGTFGKPTGGILVIYRIPPILHNTAIALPFALFTSPSLLNGKLEIEILVLHSVFVEMALPV